MGIIKQYKCMVLEGGVISDEAAHHIMYVADSDLSELAGAANEITRSFQGDEVDIEQLNNIKKSACSEDCTFCGQSAIYDKGSGRRALADPEKVVREARRAKDEGAASYCLVAAWREPADSDFERVCNMIRRINDEVGIAIECSLGFLSEQQALQLRNLGVIRYNHNLETARSKFPDICTTHTYDDRLNTLRIAREAGLELCTGGIIGMGETRRQRLELACELRALNPEEVTLNILVPIPGTPLELQSPLPESEILRMFALVRFLLPRSILKISGGRESALADEGRALLRGGANGIITSGYLTMGGNEAHRDIAMIRSIGLDA